MNIILIHHRFNHIVFNKYYYYIHWHIYFYHRFYIILFNNEYILRLHLIIWFHTSTMKIYTFKSINAYYTKLFTWSYYDSEKYIYGIYQGSPISFICDIILINTPRLPLHPCTLPLVFTYIRIEFFWPLLLSYRKQRLKHGLN